MNDLPSASESGAATAFAKPFPACGGSGTTVGTDSGWPADAGDSKSTGDGAPPDDGTGIDTSGCWGGTTTTGAVGCAAADDGGRIGPVMLGWPAREVGEDTGAIGAAGAAGLLVAGADGGDCVVVAAGACVAGACVAGD